MVQLTSMVDYEVEDGVAVLTLDNPPVNALSQGVRQGLKEGVARALADDAAHLLDPAALLDHGGPFVAVALEEAGQLDLEDGDVTIDDFSGELDINADDGDIDLSNAETSRCHVELADGRLNISKSSGVFDLETEDGDIEIRYTGLRPAEKLYEELLISGNATGTEHERIWRGKEHSVSWPAIDAALHSLERAIRDQLEAHGADQVLMPT